MNYLASLVSSIFSRVDATSAITIATFLLSFCLTKLLIKLGAGQPISSAVPWHAHKSNTPTMGGIAIVLSFLVASGVLYLKNPEPFLKLWWVYASIAASFCVGLLDDLLKIVYFDNAGLGKLDKLWLMLASIGSIMCARQGIYFSALLFVSYIPAIVFSIYTRYFPSSTIENFIDGILCGIFLPPLTLYMLFIPIYFGFLSGKIAVFTIATGVSAILLCFQITILLYILRSRCATKYLGFALGNAVGIVTPRMPVLGMFFLTAGALIRIFSINRTSIRIPSLIFAFALPFVYNFCRYFDYIQVPIATTLFFLIATGVMIASAAAFDITDGLDGLLGSIATTIFIFLAIILPQTHICSILAASIAGFLIMNLRPASIFMGDCGSLSLGTAFAAVMLALSTGDLSSSLPHSKILSTALLMSIIPLIEIASVAINICLVKLRLPRFFFAPIHHDLERRIGESQTTTLFCLVTIASCSLAAMKFNCNY